VLSHKWDLRRAEYTQTLHLPHADKEVVSYKTFQENGRKRISP